MKMDALQFKQFNTLFILIYILYIDHFIHISVSHTVISEIENKL